MECSFLSCTPTITFNKKRVSHIGQHDLIACRIENEFDVSVTMYPSFGMDTMRFASSYGGVVDFLIVKGQFLLSVSIPYNSNFIICSFHYYPHQNPYSVGFSSESLLAFCGSGYGTTILFKHLHSKQRRVKGCSTSGC